MVLEKKRSFEEDERPSKKFNSGNVPLLKLLVPNYAAGALIGKGGSLITEMQEKYGGNIRLSGSNEFYPGTEERVVVLSGKIEEIIDLNEHIMQKVQGNNSKEFDIRASKVKIVLTNAAAGVMIGRGGATIKSIREESGAKISISNVESSSVSQERVLTMSGSEEDRCRCCRLVIERIAEEQSNMANTKVKYFVTTGSRGSVGSSNGGNSIMPHREDSLLSVVSGMMDGLRRYNSLCGINSLGGLVGTSRLSGLGGSDRLSGLGGSSSFSGLGGSGNSLGGLGGSGSLGGLGGNRNLIGLIGNSSLSGLSGLHGSSSLGGLREGVGQELKHKANLKTYAEVKMEVPDQVVGAMLGKEGSVIRELARKSGAKFKFSNKNEFAEGTTNRILTIIGNMDQTYTAHNLVNEKVGQINNMYNNSTLSNQ